MRYCTYCGRALVTVDEPGDIFDTESGQRKPERWMQCPRYPRHWWQAMWRGMHDSFAVGADGKVSLRSRSWE